MCSLTKRVRLTVLVVFCLAILISSQSVDGLDLLEKEEVFDDFDSGSSSFWNLNQQEADATAWYLSKHGDPAPNGIVARRPPLEPNGGGFIEVVPLSDTVASIISTEFKLFPGSTLELVYWKAIDRTLGGRTAVLLVIVENIKEQTQTTVFRAPATTSSDPDWTTVSIDLGITQTADVRVSY